MLRKLFDRQLSLTWTILLASACCSSVIFASIAPNKDGVYSSGFVEGFASSVRDPRGLLDSICEYPHLKEKYSLPDSLGKAEKKSVANQNRQFARKKLMLELWERMDEADKHLLPFLDDVSQIGSKHIESCELEDTIPELKEYRAEKESELNDLKKAWKDWRRIDLYGMGKNRKGYGGRMMDMLTEALYVAVIRYTFENSNMLGTPYWKSKAFKPKGLKIEARKFLGRFIMVSQQGKSFTAEGRRRLSQHLHPMLKRVGLRTAGVGVRDIAEMMVWDHFLEGKNPRLMQISDSKLASFVHSILAPAFEKRYAEALNLSKADIEKFKLEQPIFDFDHRFIDQKATSHKEPRLKEMSDDEWRFHFAWQSLLLADFENLIRDQVTQNIEGGTPIDRSMPRIRNAAKEWRKSIFETKAKACKSKSISYVEHFPELAVFYVHEKAASSIDPKFLGGVCAKNWGKTPRIATEATLTGLSFAALIAGVSLSPHRQFLQSRSGKIRSHLSKGLLIGSSMATAISEVSRGLRYRDEILMKLAFANPEVSERNWRHLGWQTHFVLAGLSAYAMYTFGMDVLQPATKAKLADLSDFGHLKHSKFYTALGHKEIEHIMVTKKISRKAAEREFLAALKGGRLYSGGLIGKSQRLSDNERVIPYAKASLESAKRAFEQSAAQGFDRRIQIAWNAFNKKNTELLNQGFFYNLTEYVKNYGTANTAIVGGWRYFVPPIPGLSSGTYTGTEMLLYWIRTGVAQTITASKWAEQGKNPLTEKYFWLDTLSVLLDAGFFAKISSHITPDPVGFFTAAAAMTTFNVSLDYYFQNAVYAVLGNRVDLRNREAVKYFSVMQGGMRVTFLGLRQYLQFWALPNVEFSVLRTALTLFDLTYFYFRSHFVNQIYVDFLTDPNKTYMDALKDVRVQHMGIPGAPKVESYETPEKNIIDSPHDILDLTEKEFKAGVKILASSADAETLKMVDDHMRQRISYFKALGEAMGEF